MSAELRRQLAAARIVERLNGGPRRPRDMQLALAAAERALPEGDVDPNDGKLIEAGAAAFPTRFDYLLQPEPAGNAQAAEVARLEKLNPTERAAELKKAGIV